MIALFHMACPYYDICASKSTSKITVPIKPYLNRTRNNGAILIKASWSHTTIVIINNAVRLMWNYRLRGKAVVITRKAVARSGCIFNAEGTPQDITNNSRLSGPFYSSKIAKSTTVRTTIGTTNTFFGNCDTQLSHLRRGTRVYT